MRSFSAILGSPPWHALSLLLILLAGCQDPPRPTASDAHVDGPAPMALPAMPSDATGVMPVRLSLTGAFAHTADLAPADHLQPYAVNAALWSDGAMKKRWLTLPSGSQITFHAQGEWQFPAGTVFVKHFALPTDERNPGILRRLETRLLVRAASGGVYGVTYRWRADGSDADLLDAAADDRIAVSTASGAVRTQTWHYPSRAECLQCHNPVAGFVLGVSTRQINRSADDPAEHGANQISVLARRGWLDHPPASGDTLPHLSGIGDASASVEERSRSYLDANCAFCHRPGMVGFANFDARADTPLAEANLIRGQVIIDHGIDRARNIMPLDPWRSMILVRMESTDALRMPPVAHLAIDLQAAALLRTWIMALPGKPALPPPTITPPEGRFNAPVVVTLVDDDPQAILRYTTDGSLPDQDSPAYHAGLTVDAPTTLRVKAFRPGFASSVVANAVLLVLPPGH